MATVEQDVTAVIPHVKVVPAVDSTAFSTRVGCPAFDKLNITTVAHHIQ